MVSGLLGVLATMAMVGYLFTHSDVAATIAFFALGYAILAAIWEKKEERDGE